MDNKEKVSRKQRYEDYEQEQLELEALREDEATYFNQYIIPF